MLSLDGHNHTPGQSDVSKRSGLSSKLFGLCQKIRANLRAHNTLKQPLTIYSNYRYGYKWEKVGFRAAWVSVSQIPFIYLLSCKFNPISILTGISYERFNWLHRWAARTVFLTVIVHWSFFFREWVLADFVALEIKMMPMVKYGFGAWSTIGWMVLSGFGFFRSLSYEIFVAQHICAAATLLWVLYTHVPVYARYNIYMAIGFLAFDWSLRIIWILLRNARGRGRHSTNTFGYSARLEKLPGSMVRLIIDDVDFEWRAGQHAYLSIPRLRPFEVHPFTIANAAQSVFGPSNRRLTLLVKAHSGFSKALYKAASKNSTEDVSYRTFLSGPWGYPPCLAHYDTVVLIGCTSGASFVIPLLDDLVREAGCARAIFLHWIIRSEDHLKWFRDELSSLVEAAQHRDLRLKVVVHVTNPVRGREEIDAVPLFASESNSEVVSMATSLSSLSKEKTPLHPEGAEPIGRRRKSSSISTFQLSRPSVESLIRPAVEAAHGETAIVVCGGHSITAQTRTFVSALSDERGVHKGSGAQGIFLFTETYGL